MSKLHKADESRLTRVWLTLVTLTAVGYGLVEVRQEGVWRGACIAAVLILAGIKAFLVFRHFAGMAAGPKAYRLFFTIWISLCVSTITTLAIISRV